MELNFDKHSLIINKIPTFIKSASLHYFRLPGEKTIKDRLRKLKACGYNTVDLYFCANYHSEKEGVWDFSGNKDVSNILADENKFQLVMINLLDNAAKYSFEKGIVTVKVFNKDDKFVSINVQDNGVGIADSDLQRIFEKFIRVENHLTRKAQGSGLGLYIVKNLVEKMGGEISVVSSTKLPNSGSTFEILMPATSYASQSKKVLEDK